MTRRGLWVTAGVVLVAAWSWASLDIEAARLGEAPGALARNVGAAWPPEVGPGGMFLREVLLALLETVQIAFLSTLFGSLLSVPLALLAARNLAPTALVLGTRLFASGIRVLPAILWALFATFVVGLGPLAGILGLSLYTVGYLSKLQYEAIEGVPRDGLEAVRAMRATRFQQAWHVALPEAGNSLRSQLLFMFEYNVRASSIIGFVGAGGIGQLIGTYIQYFDYARVLTIILVLYVTVALLDFASLWVRSRFVEMSEGRRARWQDVVTGAD